MLNKINCERDINDYVPYMSAVPRSEIPEILEFVNQFEFEDQKLYDFEFKGYTFHFTTDYATRYEKDSVFSSSYYKEQYRRKCEKLSLDPSEDNMQLQRELWEELFETNKK